MPPGASWTSARTRTSARRAWVLPEPPRQAEPDSEQKLTKRQRLDWCFADLADEGIPVVAERMLAGRLPGVLDAAARNAIDDVLWAGQGALEIPMRTRRDIALALDLDDVTPKPDRFMALLDRLWVLDTPLRRDQRAEQPDG